MSEENTDRAEQKSVATPAQTPAPAPKPVQAPKPAPPSDAPESPEKKSLVVKNAVGEFIRAKQLKVSSDLFDDDALNKILKEMLDRACQRCVQNGRKTVMKHDL